MTQPLPDQVAASEPDPLDVIAQASDLASLDEELNQLPQKYRDVLVMSYFAQQTNQEIADQLNESKGAVDGRIRDARRMLRVRLARRGVEVGVLALATAYVQSSASAATPTLIQKAISLGAPGTVSQELAALNAADVAQMKLLTSTGIPLMSKIGLTIAAGLVVATGLWGMTHLAAFQDGVRDGGVAAVAEDAIQAVAGVTELSEQTLTVTSADPFGSAQVAATVGSTTAREPATVSEASAEKLLKPTGGKTAEFSRRVERESERRMNEMMQNDALGPFSYSGETPLTDILEQLSTLLAAGYEGWNGIRPDWSALAADSVALEDVIIKDIEIREGSMTIASYLDYVLSQTDPQLTWIVKDGLLLITTEAAAESEEYMFLRSYDISRLRDISQLTVSTWDPSSGQQGGGGGVFSVVFEPSQFGGLGGGSTPVRPQVTKRQSSHPEPRKPEEDESRQEVIITWEAGLIRTMQDLTGPPCRWFEIDGEGGKLSIAGNRLIVRQSRKGHEQVVAVLEQLEMAAEDGAEEQ